MPFVLHGSLQLKFVVIVCHVLHALYVQAGSSVVLLLSCAVSSMRQIQESPRSSLNQQQLALSFCQAVKVGDMEPACMVTSHAASIIAFI